MICIKVQDAFKKYLSEQSITGIDRRNVFQAYSKGREEGVTGPSGEMPDKHDYIEPHEVKLYPCIVVDCPTATPTIQSDPLQRMGTYQANILISMQVKVEDTNSDDFREMCNSLSSCIYFPENLLARKVKTCGLNIADSVTYGNQSFQVLEEDRAWVCTIELQMIAG